MLEQVTPRRLSFQTFWLGFLPGILTFMVYLPVLGYDFVTWDDQVFIFANNHIQTLGPAFFKWAWTNFDSGNWIPLTWISLASDYHFAQYHPWIYHLHNLILHALNTVLVFFVSLRLLNLAEKTKTESLPQGPRNTGTHTHSESGKAIGKPSSKIQNQKLTTREEPRSSLPLWAIAGLGSLLWGLHPIHVESVAWCSERKDVLCAFYFLLSLFFYLGYPTPPGFIGAKKRTWFLALSFFSFILSLLAKPMAITLPLILVLLDIRPLGRLREGFLNLLKEKTLFFIASIVFAVVTYYAQAKAGAMLLMQDLPLDFRVMNAFHSIVFYLYKFLVPTGLAPYYPMPADKNPFTLVNMGAALAVLILSAAFFLLRKKFPYLSIAGLYFLVTLGPVLGIVQVGLQASADRYTYLPSLGLFLLAAAQLVKWTSPKPATLALAGLVLTLGLGAGTLRQLSTWKNSIALWENAVKLFPDARVPHANLARSYALSRRNDEALREFDIAITMPPPDPHLNMEKGAVYIAQNQVDQGIAEFLRSEALYGSNVPPDLYQYLWYSYERKGAEPEALDAIQKAIRIQPDFSDAYHDMGITYWNLKRIKEAESAFQTAYSMDPSNPDYLDSLASLYQKTGRVDQAVATFNKASLLMPKEPVFHEHLGDLYMDRKDYAMAAKQYQLAGNLQPPNAQLYEKYKDAYAKAMVNYSGKH